MRPKDEESEISKRYVSWPTGPEVTALLTVNSAVPVSVPFCPGDTGAGACSTISGPITKLRTLENGPPWPPLATCARQKYVAPPGSLSMFTLVCPLAPAVTPDFDATTAPNPASFAT